MKRVLVLLVAGTTLSGAAAVYATATAPASEPVDGKTPAAKPLTGIAR